MPARPWTPSRRAASSSAACNTGLAGFSQADSQGNWSGLDVDVCRAVAAAVLGDANKVKYVPLTAQQRFTALQSGEVDILSRNTTWTLTRDASLGLDFVGDDLLRRPGLHGAGEAQGQERQAAEGRHGLRAVRHDDREEPDRLLARQQAGLQAGRDREASRPRPAPTSPAAATPTRPTPRASPRSAAGREEPGRPHHPARADLQGAARPGGAPRRRRVVRASSTGSSSA